MTEEIYHTGKLVLAAGIIISLTGGVMMLYGRMPWIGKLPGDIIIRKENFTLYFPLATSILISLLLTLVFRFFGRR